MCRPSFFVLRLTEFVRELRQDHSDTEDWLELQRPLETERLSWV